MVTNINTIHMGCSEFCERNKKRIILTIIFTFLLVVGGTLLGTGYAIGNSMLQAAGGVVLFIDLIVTLCVVCCNCSQYNQSRSEYNYV